ncbi:MAG: aminotransferase class III-fold pyridoxal phosphate-dependent enzyme [Bifidobacteriaceae bacterium]|jgi:4-aminobutyrate aminotransferase|nr:aminotransferase class III-fold pyridoxal phosphate-dependent enzyme [Bifidobacteriaceae bacterium]
MIKLSDYSAYLAPVLGRSTDLVIERGSGSYIWDVQGRRYLDWVQGIAVNALGHSHPRVVEAVTQQVAKIMTASFNLASYPPTLEWAQRLAQILPGDLGSTFFSNGGAEAVDGAIKLARAATGRPGIIAFKGAFHGRTMGATSLTTSSSKYRKGYEPLVGGVDYSTYPSPDQCPAGCGPAERSAYALEQLEALFTYVRAPETVAAVIIEPVQGEGGYVPAPAEFLQSLRAITKAHGILLICDEIQSGFGRTGKFLAVEHSGVVPDIVTLGKAMAGGLAASAIVSTPEIMSRWESGRHGSTFGGNPVVAAAGLAVLDEFEQSGIIENVNLQGDYLAGKLAQFQTRFPFITDSRGLGLMRAIELNHPDGRPGSDLLTVLCRKALEEGLLTLNCGVKGNGLRISTPLNVTEDVLDEGLAILSLALDHLASENLTLEPSFS